MASHPLILSLDLATCTGWAEGRPGEKPRFGTVRFAPAGSSQSDVFGAALKWFSNRLKLFLPNIIIYEAPLPSTFVLGRSNISTASILTGLPAILLAVARLRSIQDISPANVQAVRRHFVGKGNLKRDEAKQAVMNRCRQLGWHTHDDNAADALAMWDYKASRVDPRYGAAAAIKNMTEGSRL